MIQPLLWQSQPVQQGQYFVTLLFSYLQIYTHGAQEAETETERERERDREREREVQTATLYILAYTDTYMYVWTV